MLLTEDAGSGDYQIRAYDPGQLTINETTYERSLILSSTRLITDWEPQTLAALKAKHCESILTLKPEIILFGTGTHFALPKPEQLAPLYEAGLGVECMDTAAACRTYLALNAESRHVVAALLIR